MSNVPRAVLEAEAKADALLEELSKAQQQQQSQQTDGTPPPNEETPPQSQETPSPQNDSQTPPAGQQDDTWEHRFKVLQGKYNSEVPRFAHENKELKGRLDALQAELEVIKNAKPVEPLVKPEEIEQYGEGLIDVARRIAREEIAGKQQEIDALKAQLTSVQTVTTNNVERDFFKSLAEMVPDWQQLNEDAGFLKWLEEVDELTGSKKFDLLSRAEQSRDAVRVAKFFQTYKKTSSSWAANSARSLEQQLVPDTAKTPESPPAKKIWTRPEISDFYNRLRRGVVSDKDAIAIEADITAAQLEGRIR